MEIFNEPISRDHTKGASWIMMSSTECLMIYELHGWSVDTGLPTAATLREVGLEDVAVELQKIGRIT